MARSAPSQPERTVQLVLHYDGAAFSGWQRQPDVRTVQGVVEDALSRLCDAPVAALGAGRTDAGVHARGQSVGVNVAQKWEALRLRRAMNGVLPPDVWVARATEMRPEFHARYSALSRRYSYYVGTDENSASPFRRRYEFTVQQPLDRSALDQSAASIAGDHSFRAFAVAGTAPAHDEHRCTVTRSQWRERARNEGLVFEIEANRFLHQMVRFLVGTMLDIGAGRRPASELSGLLQAADNRDVSPPAPAHALFLDAVTYPDDLYLDAV